MYLTAAEYAQITGRDESEATTARLKRASLLLDSRIGYYTRTDGWKLDLDGLAVHEKSAVQEWVAQMVAFLTDNNDLAPSAASISLGRFSVTEHGQKGQLMPEELNLADAMLDAAGVINRNVILGHRVVESDESEV